MKSNPMINSFRFLAILTFVILHAVPGHGQQLIPQPSELAYAEGRFTITPETVIVPHESDDLAGYLNDHIERVCGFRLQTVPHTPETNYISLRRGGHLGNEAYTLSIEPEHIIIRGGDRGGVFYGLQTLFQLMPPEVYGQSVASAPQPLTQDAVSVKDGPRYAYRGAMLDVSRTFFDKQAVMQYLDWMSRHKLNKFHWHLTDDNGWRIEIKKYPELTAKGAWRGPGEVLPPSYGSGQRRYGGYYSQDDIREIVRYAAFRNIEVIPEINLPGHALALTASYPETFCRTTDDPDPNGNGVTGNVLCAAREENFEMIRDIIHEVAELFPSHYLHLGSDEVSTRYWKKCPHCQALMKKQGMKSPQEIFSYFVLRLEKIAHEEGKRCMFWDEASATNGLSAGTVISGWHDLKACTETVDRGLPVIVMPASYCYIDMKQNAFDRGHTWAWLVDTRRIYALDPVSVTASAEKSKLVRGVEGALWAELLDHPDRIAEYQAYPRLCALAEVGWSRPEVRDWNDFYVRLTGTHLARLDAMGIGFHLFAPEIKYDHGVISAASLPHATIRYTADDTDPTAGSPRYTAPIRDTLPERYRFRAFYGNAHSPVVPPAATFDTVLHASSRRTLTFPLSRYTDRNGIWYLTVTPGDPETVINRLDVTGPDTTYAIIRNGQKANPFSPLRLYIDNRNKSADLILTISNNSSAANPVSFSFRPSPCIEPKTTITSSLPFSSRFPSQRLTDYNLTSYSRSSRACKKGDYIQYTFAEPVSCRAIVIQTGIPNVTRYIVTQGTVAYSTDGTHFTDCGPLDDSGSATFCPEQPVKAVRINILGDNGEAIVALQDLHILPKLEPLPQNTSR